MKNLFITLFFICFFNFQVKADLDAGSGNLKLNRYTLNEFITYLSDGIHDEKAGINRSGTGLVFAVSFDGQDSGYYYCYKGNDCNPHTVKKKTIRYCEKKAKKNSGLDKGCFIFAIKRTIVWNNLYKKIPKNVDIEQLLDELNLVSNEKPPSDIDNEQLKQLKLLLEQGIMSEQEYNEAIKAIQ